jgi:hypothetical protein
MPLSPDSEMTRRDFLKTMGVLTGTAVTAWFFGSPNKGETASNMKKNNAVDILLPPQHYKLEDSKGFFPTQERIPPPEKEAPEGWYWLEGVNGGIITGLFAFSDMRRVLVAHENGIDDVKFGKGKGGNTLRSLGRKEIGMRHAYNFVPDGDGNIYIMGQGIGFLPKDEKARYKFFSIPPEINGKEVRTDMFGLPYGVFLNGYLWCLSREGQILRFRKTAAGDPEWKAFNIPTDGINMTIAKDEKDRLWIGTFVSNAQACGLGVWDPNNPFEFNPILSFQGQSIADIAFDKDRYAMIIGRDVSFSGYTIKPGGLDFVDTGNFVKREIAIPPKTPPPGSRFIDLVLQGEKINVITRSPIVSEDSNGFNGRTVFNSNGNIVDIQLNGIPSLSYAVGYDGKELFGTWGGGVLVNQD